MDARMKRIAAGLVAFAALTGCAGLESQKIDGGKVKFQTVTDEGRSFRCTFVSDPNEAGSGSLFCYEPRG